MAGDGAMHAAAGVAVFLFAACAAAPRAPATPRLVLPPRMAAVPGTELAAAWAGLSLAAREAAVAEQFERGNVPAFLADLVPVRLRATIGDRERVATIWCTPDVFGVGHDADWLRMPVTPQLAQRLADRLGCVLPTRRIADAIWQQSGARVTPTPFHPREHDITSVAVFAASHAAIEGQLDGTRRGTLVAGQKKDVVISALLRDWPDRVVIYGWHRPDGRAIQPLSKAHTTPHVDYSHGIRFVLRTMLVDDHRTTVEAVLADPVLHVLLSDEGKVAPARYRT